MCGKSIWTSTFRNWYDTPSSAVHSVYGNCASAWCGFSPFLLTEQLQAKRFYFSLICLEHTSNSLVTYSHGFEKTGDGQLFSFWRIADSSLQLFHVNQCCSVFWCWSIYINHYKGGLWFSWCYLGVRHDLLDLHVLLLVWSLLLNHSCGGLQWCWKLSSCTQSAWWLTGVQNL